jgi:hypothetical protein
MTRQLLSKSFISIVSIGVFLFATAAAADRSDQQESGTRQAKLYLPIAGSATGGGTFSGTFFVQKFEARDGRVVAIGMVSGSLSGAGTTLVGPLALPVDVGPGGPAAPTSAAAAAPAAQTCPVLHLAVGAVNFNVLGVQVTTQPISIDLTGDSTGTNVLGNLTCTILTTLNNVVGLVNLLNSLLGVLGGLTG